MDISDIHPLIALQQQINRGMRRLAHMTGGAEPSREVLTENLERRVSSINALERRSAHDDLVLEKRFNTLGVPKPQPVGNSLAESGSDDEVLAAQALPVTPANTPTANNTLGLDIESVDTAYLATIQIGVPPRNFSVLMDSGSADFWVGSENCTSTSGGGCGNHKFLGPRSSSSFTDSGKPFAVRYGTGNVSGTIVQDDIIIAGLTLKGHTFGVANVESPEFSSARVPFDGLMGLAQSILARQETLTPVEALTKAGLTDAPIVSYKISRLEDNKNDGEITFGGLNPTRFDPKALAVVPNVNAKGFWEANLDEAKIDGQPLEFQGRTAILDTGTTLAILPIDDAVAVHEQIPGATSDGQGGFTVPCNTTTVLSLTFGNQAFDIDPRDLAFIPLRRGDVNGDCISGITAGAIDGPTVWLLGDTFLKNAYFSTDVANNSITLAKLV